MRINKYLAECGLASRRGAEALIAEGAVKMNGKKVTELATDVDPERDHVTVNGRRVRPVARYTYVMLHKPKGCVTTASDEKGRRTVFDFIDLKARLFPVGRLDYDTEGLLLLTNDGELANKLTHPNHGIGKTYRLRINGTISAEEIKQLEQGVTLDDGSVTLPSKVRVLTKQDDDPDVPPPSETQIEIVIYEGKNHQVRRMMQAVGKEVLFLKRTAIGDIRLGGLPRGTYRFLNEKELRYLKSLD